MELETVTKREVPGRKVQQRFRQMKFSSPKGGTEAEGWNWNRRKI